MFSVPPDWGAPVPGLSPCQPAATDCAPVPVLLPPGDELLLLQAASVVTPATAMASPPTIRVLNLVISPPSSRCTRHRSAVGSSCVALLLSLFPPGPPDRASSRAPG